VLIRGDARSLPLKDGCVDTVVTSPPYWGLRDYGHGDQIGLEATPDAYVGHLVQVFRELRRVLKPSGTVWLNVGDTFNSGGGTIGAGKSVYTNGLRVQNIRETVASLKPKDLVGIPWRVAFALQADGWYLRSDIIWAKGVSFCPTYSGSVMPESVTDRPTKGHEYLFLLTKSERYFFDADAISEPAVHPGDLGILRGRTFEDGERVAWHAPSIQKRQADGVDSRTAGRLRRNCRTVWTINPEPFSGSAKTSRRVRVSWDESDGDTTRIASPSCPVHGDRAVLAAKALCGERGAGVSSHNAHTDSRLEPLPFLDSVPIDQPLVDCSVVESSDSLGLSHTAPAMPSSSRSRRTDRAPATTPPYTPSAGNCGGTDGTSALQPLTVDDSRTLENSTTGQDDLAAAASVEIPDGTIGKCSCEYYKIITEKTSHFATMPEKLVEPCILAGCPLGGLVLDPFVGSGTVVAVAQRLGRRGVGVDLSYQQLAKERTAQQGIRFDLADTGTEDAVLG
jgi:DNA modification methylase